jgi:PHD/YefM family antitoxin component YafN of YafNO toxin-antitoxin module
MTDLTISEARRALLELPERLANAHDKAIGITRRGRRVLAVMPWELYESVLETLDVLSDAEMTAALRSSLKDLERGRLVSHEEAKKRLRL